MTYSGRAVMREAVLGQADWFSNSVETTRDSAKANQIPVRTGTPAKMFSCTLEVDFY